MAGSEQLIDILSEYEAISSADLERIKQTHDERGGSLAELLVRESLIDEEDLFFLMSQRLGVPAIPEERLLHLTLSPEIRRRVPGNLARECVLVPLDLDVRMGRLSVAMFDPTDLGILYRLQHRARVAEIRAYLAKRTTILGVVEVAYGGEGDEPENPPDEEDLPWLGRSVQAPPEAENKSLDPSPSEPKVELDPSLQQEIAAFSGDGQLAASEDGPLAKAPGYAAPDREERPHGMHGRAERTPLREPIELRGRSLLRGEPKDRAAAPMPGPQTHDGTDPDLDVLPPDEEGVVHEDPEEGLSGMADTARFRLVDGAPTFNHSTLGELAAMEEELGGVTEVDGLDPSDDTDMEHEITQVVVAPPMDDSVETELPGIRRFEQREALLRELLPAVGVLASMLQERIDPGGGSYREYGRLCRLAARELGMDELTIARTALAAHLFGLDRALRQEVGTEAGLDVAVVFGPQPVSPGGLGPTLRSLGEKALQFAGDVKQEEPIGVRLVRLVADYLELRSESDEGNESDLETIAQLLRTGGGDPMVVDALVRAIEVSETSRIRVGRGHPDEDE